MKCDAKSEKHIHIQMYIDIILSPAEHYREFLITPPAQRNSCAKAAERRRHPVLHFQLLINSWDFTCFTLAGALLSAYAQ